MSASGSTWTNGPAVLCRGLGFRWRLPREGGHAHAGLSGLGCLAAMILGLRKLRSAHIGHVFGEAHDGPPLGLGSAWREITIPGKGFLARVQTDQDPSGVTRSQTWLLLLLCVILLSGSSWTGEFSHLILGVRVERKTWAINFQCACNWSTINIHYVQMLHLAGVGLYCGAACNACIYNPIPSWFVGSTWTTGLWTAFIVWFNLNHWKKTHQGFLVQL